MKVRVAFLLMFAVLAVFCSFEFLVGKAEAATPPVPAVAMHHKADLIRNARFIWGMDAPVATFAAQLHQESGWNVDAVSPVGARSMAQVMPGTERDLRARHADLREGPVTNPVWGMRALLHYDRELWQRTAAANGCHRMGKTLAKYNGGEAWIIRAERRAGSQGKDARLYFDQVELVDVGRSPAATRENRAYPRRILFALEPRYIAAGFGAGSCA